MMDLFLVIRLCSMVYLTLRKWQYLSRSGQIMWALYKQFFWLLRGRVVRYLRHKKDLTCYCWLGRWRQPYGKECGWPLGGRSSPWFAASKETGPSVLQPCGTESCQQHAWTGKQLSPQSLPVRTQPSQHLDFSLVTLSREPSYARLEFPPTELS